MICGGQVWAITPIHIVCDIFIIIKNKKTKTLELHASPKNLLIQSFSNRSYTLITPSSRAPQRLRSALNKSEQRRSQTYILIKIYRNYPIYTSYLAHKHKETTCPVTNPLFYTHPNGLHRWIVRSIFEGVSETCGSLIEGLG